MKNTISQFDALCVALQLAITAPTDKKSQQCAQTAQKIACGMNQKEVKRAKRLVVKRLKGEK